MNASPIRRTSVLVLLCAILMLPTPIQRASAQAQPAPLPAPPTLDGGAAWSDGAVCYEVFVRSFFDGDGDGIGDLAGLTAKLDYINDGNPAGGNDLGATCVWLMPVMEAAS